MGLFLVGHQSTNNHVPTSVLSLTTINTDPITTTTTVTSTTSLLKAEHTDDYPQVNLNHNIHHLIQQHDDENNGNDDDDDDDDDDDNDEINTQNVNRNSDVSTR